MSTDVPIALSPSAAQAPAPDVSALLRRWTVALVLLGVAWRCVRYLLRFPIWGDEAMNCLNLLGQDFSSILGPLRCAQVAPVLFWWGELAAYRALGGSELALRLLPLLAGLGGLLLVWRLACLTLPPLPRAVAVGFLAVGTWPVSMSTNIKPYSLDLCLSAALLVLAVQWLQRPQRLGWLLGLALVAPVALFGSFPAIFVAGSVSVALLPAVWRQPGWKARALFAAYNLLALASFAGNLLVGERQLGPEDAPIRPFLKAYWAHGFPPLAPLAFLKWAALIHTGRLMAYPLGGSDGLSVLTFVLFLVGAWRLWRGRQRALLALCLGPFALNFLAALLGRYPYGGCCRLSQHLAPIVCLLAGLGAAVLVERARSALARQRRRTAVFALLLVVGVAGAVRDVWRPYRAEGDVWMREIAREIDALSSPDDQIVVLNRQEEGVGIVLIWYLSQYRGQVSWGGDLDTERLKDSTSQVWCLDIGVVLPAEGGAGPAQAGGGWLKGHAEPPRLVKVKDQLARDRRPWALAGWAPYALPAAQRSDCGMTCHLYRWVNPASPGLSAHARGLSCRP